MEAQAFALAWKGNISSDKVARVNPGVVSVAWWGGQAATGIVMIGRNADERQVGGTACSRCLVTRRLSGQGCFYYDSGVALLAAHPPPR